MPCPWSLEECFPSASSTWEFRQAELIWAKEATSYYLNMGKFFSDVFVFFFLLLKLYFIDYAVVPIFPSPLGPLHPAPPAPPGNSHTIVHIHGSCLMLPLQVGTPLSERFCRFG